MNEINIWADGSCVPNPGKGGVGIVMVQGSYRKEWSEYIGESTNNSAEIRSIILSLRKLRKPGAATVYMHTDSDLVIGFLEHDFIAHRNGVAVADMKELVARCKKFVPVKVVGHNGEPENEQAHKLALQAALYSGHGF
jgi:ribonuclease HI